MDIEQVELDPTTLAVVRERVAIAELAPFYDRAYGQVAAALGAAGLSPAGPAVGWYASMPGSDVEVAAGFPVRPGDVPLGTELDGAELQTVPGGPAVAALHVGPYDELGDAWTALDAWCRERGLHPRGDFWEEYVTDPNPGGDPSRNVTRLVLPLV